MKRSTQIAFIYLIILSAIAAAGQSATGACPANAVAPGGGARKHLRNTQLPGDSAAQAAVDIFAASRGVAPESVAVLITDIADGRVLAAHNSAAPLIPASITKAVTIASLLQHSDIDARLHTQLLATGPTRDGTLRGNLIIVGSGDPTLNSTEAPYTPDFIGECVAALRKIGVDSIAGRIIADESIFSGPSTPPSWENADLRHSYGAGCFGINFENNSAGKRSVSNPAGVLQTRLHAALERSGIGLGNNDFRQGERDLIFDHASAPLDEIMRSCMVRSDNLYAEAMLRHYALAAGRAGATNAGAEAELAYWRGQGADAEGVQLVDGSGLSRSNRLTANFLTDVLLTMCENANYASFFPLAGQEGTLRNFLRDTPLDSYIALKTGSMNGIQCYAGYMLDDDYAPTHTVVIIINDMKGARASVKRAAADMLMRIFAPESATPPEEGGDAEVEE